MVELLLPVTAVVFAAIVGSAFKVRVKSHVLPVARVVWDLKMAYSEKSQMREWICLKSLLRWKPGKGIQWLVIRCCS